MPLRRHGRRPPRSRRRPCGWCLRAWGADRRSWRKWHIGAVGGEPLGDGKADATAAAGHDDGLPLQRHRSPPGMILQCLFRPLVLRDSRSAPCGSLAGCSKSLRRFPESTARNRDRIVAGVLGVCEHIAICPVNGSEFQSLFRAASTKGFDILHVKDELDSRLATSLSPGGFVDHQVCAAILAEEFNNSVAGLSGRVKTEVSFVKANRLLNVACIEQDAVYRQCIPL